MRPASHLTPDAHNTTWHQIGAGVGWAAFGLSNGQRLRTVAEQMYSDSFYAEMSDGSQASARHVIPIILELFDPHSVVDVGCGIGDWLSEFRRAGIVDVAGLDGPWVPRAKLLIPSDLFSEVDISQPMALDRRYDLATCLEVAEHIDGEHARNLVESLTSLAPVVVFSAAIPFQTGTNHVNEQWPSYWVSLFAERRYSVRDCLRPRIWDEPEVEYWYAQNLLVFISPEAVKAFSEIGDTLRNADGRMLDLVHPRAFLAAQAQISHLKYVGTLRWRLRSAMRAVRARAKRPVRRPSAGAVNRQPK